SYDFGARPLGTTTTKVFTVTNQGGYTASAITVASLAAPFQLAASTCGATLAASDTCDLTVTFHPTQMGSASATLRVDYQDGVAAASATRDVTGTGARPAGLTISDGPQYDFGSRALGSVTDKSLTVTNGGDLAATALSAS